VGWFQRQRVIAISNVYKWRHRNKTQLVVRIKSPTKCIFRNFHSKWTEWRRFVTYLWNDPRISRHGDVLLVTKCPYLYCTIFHCATYHIVEYFLNWIVIIWVWLDLCLRMPLLWSMGHLRVASIVRDLEPSPLFAMWDVPPSSRAPLLYCTCSWTCHCSFVLVGSTGGAFLWYTVTGNSKIGLLFYYSMLRVSK